jgi:diphthamide synthase (EF-2-diphthine--ammonia ligase)
VTAGRNVAREDHCRSETDGKLLEEFSPGIDPCDENGKFHTIVVGGPLFCAPITVRVVRTVERDGFAYADIISS